MVLEDEVVELRGREPRRSGFESHLSPQARLAQPDSAPP